MKSSRHRIIQLATVAIVGLYFALTIWQNQRQAESSWDQFAAIPIVSGGRIQPVDSYARNQLMSLSGKSSIKLKETGEKLGPRAWFAEVLFLPELASTRPCFRVENEEVKALFGEQASAEKNFSYQQIQPGMEKIAQLAERAEAKEKPQLTVFDQQISQLHKKLKTFRELSQCLPAHIAAGEVLTEQELITIVTANQGLKLLLVPPADEKQPLTKWQNLGTYLAKNPAVAWPAGNDGQTNWFTLAHAYQAANGQPDENFQQCCASYLEQVRTSTPDGLHKADHEFTFYQLAPFQRSLPLYLLAGLIILASWSFSSQRTASWLTVAMTLLTTLWVIHTCGLAMRVYLSGRPPVTNLYSSAVFIGWAAISFALLIESKLLKNGIGGFIASVIGTATLIIAYQLSFDGDTMEVKQAVLDSNFWLATHVIIITLGYSANYLLGLLAITHTLRSWLSGSFTNKQVKQSYQLIYGVTCFALLFSFIGTILGGIWADQSWGRFWGWDPKENGALMIVLWNTIMLHARLSGLCRVRGFIAMGIFSMVITSWSWFGTNLLGIGLHSYGFREGAMQKLAIVCAALTLIAIASLAKKHRTKES
ncbi:cytochrome c biogenesis protein [Persicirhabdus sediminis]|uniref:Cytochrome c biogenesis protein CcsA n=1 Tax=Persicirhabdus sediminis TaxID=454144 RepID=A0A8J7MF61_9BACT|nr:cytochrome c biogenesis protein CcsA [Persicirhabdus sediminis]MBK1790684.1 cytochrome c biogenesis protein CcsA [Persicirhabdus sediminis]